MLRPMRGIIVVVAVVAACGPGGRSGNGDDTGDDDMQFPNCDPSLGNTCNGNDVVTCNADGTYGSTVMSCTGSQVCSAGACMDQCSNDASKLIYVIDDSNHFRSFDPTKLASAKLGAFTDLGELNCPHSSFPIDGSDNDVTPMSMSVDREANAWILYTSGEIVVAPIASLSTCHKTTYKPGQQNMDLFGMGFVSDTNGADAEHLYIAGGDVMPLPGGNLAVIDPMAMSTTKVGKLTSDGENSPELTGTGGGQLWGFWPGIDTAFVQQIDRTSGGVTGTRLSIPGGLGGPGATPSVTAWAFAQFDGVFYIFATTKAGDEFPNNPSLRTIDATGAYTQVMDDMPFNVVGAGVSTCAPFVIE
jgi:hypothetical protein